MKSRSSPLTIEELSLRFHGHRIDNQSDKRKEKHIPFKDRNYSEEYGSNLPCTVTLPRRDLPGGCENVNDRPLGATQARTPVALIHNPLRRRKIKGRVRSVSPSPFVLQSQGSSYLHTMSATDQLQLATKATEPLQGPSKRKLRMSPFAVGSGNDDDDNNATLKSVEVRKVSRRRVSLSGRRNNSTPTMQSSGRRRRRSVLAPPSPLHDSFDDPLELLPHIDSVRLRTTITGT